MNAFSFFPATVRAGFLHHHYVAREDDDIVSVCVGAFEPQKFGANFNLTINTVDGTLCKCIICNSLDITIIYLFLVVLFFGQYLVLKLDENDNVF